MKPLHLFEEMVEALEALLALGFVWSSTGVPFDYYGEPECKYCEAEGIATDGHMMWCAVPAAQAILSKLKEASDA